MELEKLKDMLYNAAGGPVGIQMCHEAADAIEQLQAENEKLKRALAEMWFAYEEFAEDVIRQFAYKVKADGRCAYSTGGLSTLEWAFSILGWPDPKPAPECECQEEGCHERAVGGRPTPDGYKWLCSRHFEDYKAREEAEA